ncbi:uncharacterized protein [Penaeus vannamei]|uniref:uncharacterized protein n=1 Tax=Penaeus vannamei TaxID=6689 RepID=UPI00387F67CA
MVIRNINPSTSCNVKKNVLVGNILGGVRAGEQVAMSKITLTSTGTLQKRQIPVKLSFAMTINRSQWQTFDRCGLLLDAADCFSQGQFYVACLRMTKRDSLIICTGTTEENGEIATRGG